MYAYVIKNKYLLNGLIYTSDLIVICCQNETLKGSTSPKGLERFYTSDSRSPIGTEVITNVRINHPENDI